MSDKLSQQDLDQLFVEARTHNMWQPKEVPDELLMEIWETVRWAPTSMNCNPCRITFVRSTEAKEKLKDCLSEGNIEKTMAAPVTAIFALDTQFFKFLPRLFPNFAGAADMFDAMPDLADETAQRNATLQAAYFMIGARAMGLDCGPMSGFDNKKLDEAFFANTTYKSNFLCNLGYGDRAGLYNRGPRPAFDEVCKVV